MKHTSESLAAMSDDQLNKLLSTLVVGHDLLAGYLIDYCNNPSDVMPLVFEHGNSLITTDGGKLWFAEFDTEVNAHFILCSKISFQDPKPLRAAACCLILVLQEIKEIEK